MPETYTREAEVGTDLAPSVDVKDPLERYATTVTTSLSRLNAILSDLEKLSPQASEQVKECVNCLLKAQDVLCACTNSNIQFYTAEELKARNVYYPKKELTKRQQQEMVQFIKEQSERRNYNSPVTTEEIARKFTLGQKAIRLLLSEPASNSQVLVVKGSAIGGYLAPQQNAVTS